MRKNLCFILPILLALYFAVGPLAGQQGSGVRESRVPVEGADLYARDVGKGPAILILHGGPDFDQSYMLPEMDRLSDSYHLIYYDQRGRGKSAEPVKPEDVTLASDIADIEKVRQYFHLDSVTLLGHSWGTVLALEYALKYPEHVSRLILMNPAPAAREDYLQLRKEWLETRPEAVAQKKAIAETTAYKEGDPEAVEDRLMQEDYEKLIARMHASFHKEGVLKARAVEDRLMQDTWANSDFDLLPQIKSLKISTFVLSGDHEFIPVSSAEHIAHAIPNARLTILKGCGHFTFMECPGLVHEEIDRFFAGKTSSRGQ